MQPLDLRDIHPLSDFVRNTKAHVQKLRSPGMAEVLTVNGRAELVVLSAETYQKMLDELESARLCESLVRGEADYMAGRAQPAAAAIAELKADYGVHGSDPAAS